MWQQSLTAHGPPSVGQPRFRFHISWPSLIATYRHTLPFKAFLVSISTVFGLVLSADTALLRHERFQRANESDIRTEARIDLARRGLVPTETAIRQWREEHEQKPDSV